MVTVDVRLNRYQYRFRKLTYREEFALDRKAGVDGQKTVLASALVEVSGLPIPSPADALRILSTVPVPVLNRVWVLYRSGVAEDRFFSTTGLYRAPDPHQLNQIQEASDVERSRVVDHSLVAMEQKFGRQEVAETMVTERRLIEDARRRGALTPATPEGKS
jgi:hypothetical protein